MAAQVKEKPPAAPAAHHETRAARAADSETRAAPIADNELLIVRTFDAPASLVFRLWEMPEHMSRWLGPQDFTCTTVEIDFRPGGRWRARIESPERGERWMGGEYREIERDRRIVTSFAWDPHTGDPSGACVPNMGESVITVTFAERDGKTVQSFHQTPFSTVEARDGHDRGWNLCFDQEEALVAALLQETRS